MNIEGREKVIVIGGAGFIGSRLCLKLRETGYEVLIFDKKPNEFTSETSANYIQGDVRNPGDLRAAVTGCDLIYNLAAEHQDNVQPLSLYTEVNVIGAHNVCTAASEAGIRRIIFTSSVAVYGSQSNAMTEDAQHLFFNEYGRTKHLAEGEYLAWMNAASDRRLTIVRPTVVFGPGNRGNVYNFLRQMKYGPFVMFGDGSNIKSMAHVENIASFLAFLAARPERHAVYNYADKPDFSVRQLVSFVDRALGRSITKRPSYPKSMGLLAGKLADAASWAIRKPLPISEVRVQKFCAPSEIDASKALTTGFIPPTKLEDGLASMVQEHV